MFLACLQKVIHILLCLDGNVYFVWGPGYHCIYTLYADRENFKPMDMFESSQARKQAYIGIPET